MRTSQIEGYELIRLPMRYLNCRLQEMEASVKTALLFAEVVPGNTGWATI